MLRNMPNFNWIFLANEQSTNFVEKVTQKLRILLEKFSVLTPLKLVSELEDSGIHR